MQHKQDIVISAIRRQIENSNHAVELDSRIEELSMDSLKFIMLIIDLQDESNMSIDISKVGSAITVRDLVDIIEYT